MADGSVVVVGGSSGIGKEIARHYADQGKEVVLTSRDPARAEAAAKEVGGKTTGIALDLTRPAEIADALADVGQVDHLVLVAIQRDQNTVRDFNIQGATELVVLKLVGYPEVVHSLIDRMDDESSIVLFGGLAKERPYPGSTIVTTVNGGVNNMIRTLAIELAPIRVNAIHPGFVADSPYWVDRPEAIERVRARTPTDHLVSTQDVVEAVAFLLENRGVNGVNLWVDSGWTLT